MSKIILHNLPELYLILGTLFYWMSTANALNPIAIILLGLLIYQLFYQKLFLGITIASIFILASLFLVLAMISELKEFSAITNDFLVLLGVGSTFILLNIFAGIFLIKKHTKLNLQPIL